MADLSSAASPEGRPRASPPASGGHQPSWSASRRRSCADSRAGPQPRQAGAPPSAGGVRITSPVVRDTPRLALPGELELELGAVVVDLELDLEVDLVGHMRAHAHPALLELDVVVARQLVGERPQARGALLAAQPFLALDLYEVHVWLRSRSSGDRCSPPRG